jgi:hypothetical protein
MDSWQRCAALGEKSGTAKVVKNGLLVSGIGFVLVYSVPLLMGIICLSGAFGKNLDQDRVLFVPLLFLGKTASPITQIISFIIIGSCFIAALLSTSDTLLNAAVYSLVYDILGVRENLDFADFSPVQHKKVIAVAQTWTVLFGFSAIVVAFLGFTLRDLIWAFFSSQIVFAVPLTFAVFWPNFVKGRSLSAMLSIPVGFVTPIIMVVLAKIFVLPGVKEAAPLGAILISLTVFVLLLPFKKGTIHE